jgi:Antitoxin Xre/MbcA/ParS C-terminal toxin-binding domain
MEQMNREDRVTLTRAIIALLDDWGVSAADQIGLLALPAGTRPGAIRQFRQSTPFPEDARVMERIEHLIGIADALRTSYPHNAHMGSIWMNKANHRFENRTPLAAMIEDGLGGFVAVRTHLDCAYDWHLSGSDGKPK